MRGEIDVNIWVFGTYFLSWCWPGFVHEKLFNLFDWVLVAGFVGGGGCAVGGGFSEAC